MRPSTRHGTGQVGEHLVAAELARYGFTVALPTGNAEAMDILARGNGMTFAVQVKSASRGHHQFNLSKFVDIEFAPDGGQIVNGSRQDIDRGMYFVLVLVGDRAGDDEFLWTTVGEFSDFLAKSHREYLEKHGGRRPGKNPKSLHSAIPLSLLKKSNIGKSLVDTFGLQDQG